MDDSLVLKAVRLAAEAPVGPGDAAIKLGAPRYKVLALFHFLEELGLVEKVYSKGSYKVYVATELGRKVLYFALEGYALSEMLRKGVEALRAGEEGEESVGFESGSAASEVVSAAET